ncbi:MAG: TonB-dependent receptor [Bacteroidetes bacterium]|nr:TonB-dependent receptor [Bacteroidota bacterium]
MSVRFICLLILLAFAGAGVSASTNPNPPAAANDAKLSRIYGKVVDRATKEPLIGANVIILQTQTGAATDLNGSYSIEKIPGGIYNVKISMLGYTPIVKTDISVSPLNPTYLNIELESATIELKEEIVVEGSYFYKPTETPTSMQSYSYEEIRRAPGAAGDISRMIQTMPGVVQTTDSRNDLIVRGGSPAENLNLVDGFEIPNINHFGSQGSSGGPIGMMQTEFISEANFLTGGFPSLYGDKLSSILDIRLREGNPDRLTGNLEMSMAGAGGTFEGPIGKSTTFMFNARRSYLDLIQDAIQLAAVPGYTNINAKVTHTIDEHNSLNFVALAGFDDIHFKDDPKEKDLEKRLSEDVKSGGYQYLMGASWRHLFDNKSFGNLYLWNTWNNYNAKVYSLLPPDGTKDKLQVDNESDENTAGVKYMYSTYLGKRIEFNAGSSLLKTGFHYNLTYAGDTNAFGGINQGYKHDIEKSFIKGSAYSQVVYKPLEDWKFTVGGRVNYFEALKNEFSFDPRVGASYAILPYLNLNASWGIFHQSPEWIWLYGNEVPNTNLTYVKAMHSVVGFDYYPDSDIKITLEAYIKNYTDYPVSLRDSMLSLANSGDDFGPNGIASLASKGTGKSMGIDFFVQKKLTDKVYGLVSYSYSRTKHKALDGVERPGSFDIPNVLTLTGGYKFSETLEISGKYRFINGRPYTPVNMAASQAANRMVLDVNKINENRYPDYYRFDVRVDHRTFFDNFTIVSFFELQNATGKQNIYGYMWNKYSRTTMKVYQWDRLFIGGVKVEF